MQILNILIMLLFATLTKAYKKNLIDPHEMIIDIDPPPTYDNKEKVLEKSFSEGNIKEKQECYKSSPHEEAMAIMYLKRTINLLLSTSTSDPNSADVYTGSYQYVSDSEEHQFLMNFVNSKVIDDGHLRKLDTVLNTLFSKSNQESIFNFNTCISRENLAELFNTKTLVVLGITVGLIVSFLLFRNNYGLWFIICYFLTVMLIVDYGIRYQQLYEAVQEHNLQLKYDSVCDTTKMSWSEYFKFALSNKDCERKVVTPLEVSLNQLKSIIIVPLASIGNGMGQLGSNLWEKLPFPWNILMFPLMLLFILSLVFLYILAVKNTTFKLKLLHMLNLELGSDRSDENRIGGPTLDKFLQTLDHRPRLEDTRSTPPKEKRKKIKEKSPPKKNQEKQRANSNSPTKDVHNVSKTEKIVEVKKSSAEDKQSNKQELKNERDSEETSDSNNKN